MLTMLRLWRRPGTAAGRTMDEDIAEITRRFAIDPGALRRVVEQAGIPPSGQPEPSAG